MSKLRRRLFLIAAGTLLALPLAKAQQVGQRIPRIGLVLSSGSSSRFVDGLKRGLRDLGYVERRDYLIEIGDAEGRNERMRGLVDKFVQQKVDVIFAPNNVAILVAKKATKTIPIVMVSTIDPIAAGYVDSLARPGANITGLAMLTRDLSSKRIELLREILPKMERVAILWDAGGPGPIVAFKAYEATALNSKLRIQSLEVREPNPDLDGAFRAARKGHADALIIVTNPLVIHHRIRIMDLANSNRLPAMYESSSYVNDGGLLSYGANASEIYRGVAAYVDKILKGAKPADLPIQQPTNF